MPCIIRPGSATYDADMGLRPAGATTLVLPAGRPLRVAAAACAALVVAAGLPARVAGAQQDAAAAVPEPVRQVLASVFGFSHADMDAVARGRPVVRGLTVHDDREVSAVGVIRVYAPPAFYADQMRDIVRFKRHEAVQQIGVFGRPARAADMAGLTLDGDDLRALRRCSPASCDVNLSAEAIADAGNVIAWGTPSAVNDAQAWYRDTLARMVREYQTSGSRALMTYVSGDRRVSTAAEFDALLSSPPALLDAFPGVRAYLAAYPRDPSHAVDDVIYWSKEEVGPKLVISVTHMAIAKLPATAAPVAYAAASRQLYGSTLYEASLGLTVLIADPDDDARMYLVYANRSRVDAIGGLFGPIKRAVVRSRARATLGPTLERAKREVERRYAAAGSQP